MLKTFSLRLLPAAFLALLPASAAIITTNNTNALTLANNLVGGGGITVNSATLSGGAASSGTFTNAPSPLPFSSGVFLNTGTSNCIAGPNNLTNCGATASGAGTASIAGSTDSTVLTMVFTPVGDEISFQYVFGSEEYEEYVGTQFNDAFVFLLNGVNIALVPGTNAVVSINTVNQNLNTAYYGNNAGGANYQYDGFAGTTTALFAGGKVNPGVQNTIVLAIADRGDSIFDSGVFIKAGSFINEPPPSAVPEPATTALMVTGFGALVFFRKRISSK